MNDGTHLLFGSTIFHQHGIIGRGTCVVRANRVEKGKDNGTDDDTWNGPLIVKLSWPAKSRISEDDIIKQARNAADHEEHRPQTSSPVHFADDTLGGLVTFDKFQTILDASLP